MTTIEKLDELEKAISNLKGFADLCMMSANSGELPLRDSQECISGLLCHLVDDVEEAAGKVMDSPKKKPRQPNP